MKKWLSISLFAALFTIAQGASAVIILDFGTEFSESGGSLSGTVQVTIDDGGGAGSVDVTIDTNGLDNALTEYVAGLYLNLDPAINPAALGTATDGGTVDPVGIALGVDAFQADGDGLYDIRIDFPSAGANRLIADLTETVTFTLAGLVEEDFDFLSAPAGGKGPFVSALRARSLGADGQDSGWFFPERDGGPPQQIPEPGILMLLAAGFLGLVVAGRRRRCAAA